MTTFGWRAIRIALAMLFAAAVASKLKDPSGFVESVREYGLVPEGLERLVAGLVVSLEATVVVLLFRRDLQRHAFALAGSLLAAFALAAGFAATTGHDGSCGCFIGLGVLNRWEVSAVDSVLAILLLLSVRRSRPQGSRPEISSRAAARPIELPKEILPANRLR